MQMTSNPPKPWYKSFWPWFLFTLPAIAVVASIYTFVLAVRSDDGVVDDDYYKQGQAINQDLGRDQAAVKLGISAQFMLGADGRTVRVVLARPLAATPTLQLDVLHPTQAGLDQHVKLHADGPQMYSGQLAKALVQPRWDIELGDETNQWRLRGLWKTGSGEPLQLPAR
ncbi:hypothetical protein IGB42_02172 [Andreprevotia sp. IGB-42]|uniref:FixH family protein n=1 Tax=Andreprevotia sp. IGB-42 TaxID=2497473 RepID=UPI00135AB976|nr:FixH family protein [Andreprevotia sp. IGB-42]KAF0813244.1 hypothetical protein IGB42_02172 [Andreprevotia sp. IGB-42]